MPTKNWKLIFTLCHQTLVANNSNNAKDSYCAWTTFDRLESAVHYWDGRLPAMADIQDNHIAEGFWSQPFLYESLAHLIIPKKVFWEKVTKTDYSQGEFLQDVETLAQEFDKHKISYLLSNYWLEIKLF